MLFISRFVGTDRYGVVDSDDNVEQVVTFKMLLQCVNAGLDIKGVVTRAGASGVGITEVGVWEGLRVQTPYASKLLMLRGIDIRVWGGKIGAIFWDAKSMTAPVTIRLSDFGRVVCDRVMYFARADAGLLEHDLTIVLDDKIVTHVMAFQLSFATFSGLGGSGHLIIDLREVTNNAIVEDVYRGLQDYLTVLQADSRLNVLDRPDRYQKWITKLARD